MFDNSLYDVTDRFYFCILYYWLHHLWILPFAPKDPEGIVIICAVCLSMLSTRSLDYGELLWLATRSGLRAETRIWIHLEDGPDHIKLDISVVPNISKCLSYSSFSNLSFKINRGRGTSVFITYRVSAGFLNYIRQTRCALWWLVYNKHL